MWTFNSNMNVYIERACRWNDEQKDNIDEGSKEFILSIRIGLFQLDQHRETVYKSMVLKH